MDAGDRLDAAQGEDNERVRARGLEHIDPAFEGEGLPAAAPLALLDDGFGTQAEDEIATGMLFPPWRPVPSAGGNRTVPSSSVDVELSPSACTTLPLTSARPASPMKLATKRSTGRS